LSPQEVLRTCRSLRQRLHRSCAPVAAAEHREAAIDCAAGVALEPARGPADLSQPAAAATSIVCPC